MRPIDMTYEALLEAVVGPKVAGDLMRAFPTIEAFAAASPVERRIKGMTPTREGRLVAALELGHRVGLAPRREEYKLPIDCSERAFRLLRSVLRGPAERTAVLLLNSRIRPLGPPIVIAEGTVSNCLVHPRQVFELAIMRHAASWIFGHNHPSGDPAPSLEDSNLTRRLYSAGEALGCNMLDHIVVADHDSYYSYADNNWNGVRDE